MVEDEHKELLERQKLINESVLSLPEFMAEMRKGFEYVKALPTQKDIDTIFTTKLKEYDEGWKKPMNEFMTNIDARITAIEQRPAAAAGNGGFISGLIQNVMEGKIQVPGLNGILGGGQPAYEQEIGLLEREFMGRVRLNYRYQLQGWLDKIAIPSPVQGMNIVGEVVKDTPRLAGP